MWENVDFFARIEALGLIGDVEVEINKKGDRT